MCIIEGGINGDFGGVVVWFGVFCMVSSKDILFVVDDIVGFGYFCNFGKMWC